MCHRVFRDRNIADSRSSQGSSQSTLASVSFTVTDLCDLPFLRDLPIVLCFHVSFVYHFPLIAYTLNTNPPREQNMLYFK